MLSGTLTGALAVGETLRIYDGATYLGNAASIGNNWSYSDSRTLVHGQTLSYTARVADENGNESPAGTPYTASIDKLALPPSLSLAVDTGQSGYTSDNVTSNTSLNVAGLESGATWQYQFDGTMGTWLDGTGGSLTMTEGTHTYFVRQTDLAGNSSSFGSQTVTLDTTAPTATIASYIYVAATDNLLLNGSNFNTLLENGEDANTDIKGRLNWNKLSYDIDGNTAQGTTDVGFTLSDIANAKVTANGTLSIVLSTAKATALEGTSGFAGAIADTVDVQAGFTKDLAGNAATTDSVINAVRSIIDLGTYGLLIAPVQVEGKWYYYWDRSGDGTSADIGTLNGGLDYTNHDVLDSIFKYDASFNVLETTGPVVGVVGDTDNTYRYATLNGVKVALPTYGSGLSGNNASPTGVYKLGTAVSSGAVENPTYNDLLAIWDAYNGTSIGGTGLNGVPSGWRTGSYSSATPSLGGHARVHLDLGFVQNTSEDSLLYVALEVL